MAVMLLQGASADESRSAFGVTHGPDLGAELGVALNDELAAFGAAGAFETIVHHPAAGDVPGVTMYGFRTGDYLLHGWDIARAIGDDERLPEDLVASIWDDLQPRRPSSARSECSEPARAGPSPTMRPCNCGCWTSRDAGPDPVAVTAYVALLRGINVGGHAKVAMAELRASFIDMGFADATTYIQSGNVVFTASGSATRVRSVIEKGLETRFGLGITVVVRTRPQSLEIIGHNPLAGGGRDPAKLHVTFLAAKPTPSRSVHARPGWVPSRRVPRGRCRGLRALSQRVRADQAQQRLLRAFARRGGDDAHLENGDDTGGHGGLAAVDGAPTGPSHRYPSIVRKPTGGVDGVHCRGRDTVAHGPAGDTPTRHSTDRRRHDRRRRGHGRGRPLAGRLGTTPGRHHHSRLQRGG